MSNSLKSKVAVDNQSNIERQKNSIYFIGGEKGGVGKSFFARCLVDYFISKGWIEKFYLVDGDPTIADVGATVENGFEKVRFSDNKYNWDQPNIIVDRIEEKTAVVNLASNVMTQFDSWIDRLGVLSIKEEYCQEIVYFFVTDGCWRSIQLFLKQLERYDTNVFPHCLVLNRGRLTSSGDFSYLNNFCPELIQAVKKHKVPIIYLPELSATAQFICDRTNMSYSKLRNASKEEVQKELEEQIKETQLAKKMSSKITAISVQRSLYQFLLLTGDILNQVFPKQLENPEGLKSICEKQKKSIEEGLLPDSF